MVSPKPDTFDEDYLLLAIVGRETSSHFDTPGSNPWFIDVIEKITENTQAHTRHEGLILPYSNQNQYEEGQEALYNKIVKITAIHNISAGKDYDPEDWISNIKESQVDSPNLTLYGDSIFEILTKTANVITVKYLGSTHVEHVIHNGDFVAYPSTTAHYDSAKVGQISNIIHNTQTQVTTATITFDVSFSPSDIVGATIQLLLLNYLSIFANTKGVIINKVDSSDGIPHPHFINLDFFTNPVYISPAELNQPGHEKDIYVDITEPHTLKFQDRNISKTTEELQRKLFLAISNRITQDRYENDTNKYWLSFALQYKPNDYFGAPLSNIGKGTQTNDAVRFDQTYDIAREEATKHFIEDYSESASFYKGKQASFNDVIQRAAKDIPSNTPYNPIDWLPPLEVQQSGLVENVEFGYRERTGLNYYVSVSQGGTNPLIWIKSTISGIDVSEFSVGDYLYLISNIPELDGNLAKIKRFNPTGSVDTIEFELTTAITLPNSGLRILAFAYPNTIKLQKPAKGIIVNKKFSDGKYHMIPVNADNPGITTHTDKFDNSFDGWSVYDVQYTPGQYYGSVSISNQTEHGGSLLLDLTTKYNSYYYYGGAQKAFTKDSADSWENIEFDWRSTAIPINGETATKLLCRILDPANNNALLKEVILIQESLLADSGWRNDTIDVSDLNSHDSLLFTIVYDDHRWLDAQLKLYLDNFKVHRIHGANYISIPDSDLASATYHKQLVISKDDPTQFSLIEPPANRDSLHENYIHLANIIRNNLSRWPTKYFPLIKKIQPYQNLQEHLENRILGKDNNHTQPIAGIAIHQYFSLLVTEITEATTFPQTTEKELVLEELYLTMFGSESNPNAEPVLTPTILQVIVNGNIISSVEKNDWNSYNQITLIVGKQFIETDQIEIKLTYPSLNTNVVANVKLQAKIRRMGI